MANAYPFIDRNPQIIPAGLLTKDQGETIEDCFKIVSLEDKVNALKHEAGIYEDAKSDINYATFSQNDQRYCGMFTQMREILKTPPRGLKEELLETTYSSYWNQPLGATRDQTPGLPAGMDVYTTTFGKKTDRSAYTTTQSTGHDFVI